MIFKSCRKILPLSDKILYGESHHNITKLGKKKLILGLKCLPCDEFSASEGNDSPVYSCKFSRNSSLASILALAYEDGRIVIQNTQKSNVDNSYIIEKDAHNNAIFEISWVPNKSEIISAVADTSLSLWSLQEDLVQVQKFNGHTKSVKSVDVNSWDPYVFGSGGRDCNVIVWDTRCIPSHKANEIIGAHSTSHKSVDSPRDARSRVCQSQVQNSVISLLFNQQHQLITAGASDGLIKIWDLRRTYRRGKKEPLSLHVLEHAGQSFYKGYTSMCLSPFNERVYASCLDGSIYAYHLTNPTLKPVAEYFGHRPNTYYAKISLSPCGSYLVSGSSDDKAYIWVTDEPGPPAAYLTGHSDEVTCVAWGSSNTGETLVTCSDDLKHRLFRQKFLEEELTESNQEYKGFAFPFDKSSVLLSRKTHLNFNGTDVTNGFQRTQNDCSQNGPNQNLPLPNILLDKETPITKGSPWNRTPSSTRTRNSHVTPGTSGNKSLMAWLSSNKKTPQSKSLLKTPTSESTTKKKHVLKRKLTDLMEEDQENIPKEVCSKSSPTKSPPFSVLSERDNLSTNSNSVAKMLKYDQSNHHYLPSTNTSDSNYVNCEDLLNFKLLEDQEQKVIDSKTPVKLPSALLPNLCSPQLQYPSNNPKLQFSPNLASPNSQTTKYLLSSPTANLPNYVIDGTSPHNRRPARVVRERQQDWLTTLGQKKNEDSKVKDKPCTQKNNVRRSKRSINIKLSKQTKK